MTVESTRCAAAAVPVRPDVSSAEHGALRIVFELYNQFWDCECCGGIDDLELVLRVNGTEVRSWREDGHFGSSRIDWQEALALAMAFAGARLTVYPLPESTEVGPYSLVVGPPAAGTVQPVPTRTVVWTCATEAIPEGGCSERVHVRLDGVPMMVWHEEAQEIDPLSIQGPVLESLRALGAIAQAVTIEPMANDDENEGDAQTLFSTNEEASI